MNASSGHSLVGSSELCPSHLDFIALKVTLLPVRSPDPTAIVSYKSEVLPTSSLISGPRSLPGTCATEVIQLLWVVWIFFHVLVVLIPGCSLCAC